MSTRCLIYELFSGVGFFNQLFSFETAIYLANITNRKLVLLVRNPLCHCGRASWDYGKFVDFFSDDYKQYLPYGIDVYYKTIPGEIKSLIDSHECHTVDFPDKFSRIVMIDSGIGSDADIKEFCSGRKSYQIDFDSLSDHTHIYICHSNASRCFYNFYTTEDHYKLMSDICYSLTKLKIFEKINIPNNAADYVVLHLRLGDKKHSKQTIDKNNNLSRLNNIKRNVNAHIGMKKGLYIMCDRRDGDILQELTELYPVEFIEDLLQSDSYRNIYPVKNHSVIEFLIQMKICTSSDCFIGYESSTVSNYIQYLQYINNKTCNLYTKKNIINGSPYTWVDNNYRGPGISWQVFFKDNIYKPTIHGDL